MSDEQLVTAVVERWRQAWEAADAEELKALWAQSHPCVTYQPTELEVPLTSYAEIADYCDRVCGMMRNAMLTAEWRTLGVVVDVLSSDTAFAFAPFEHLIQGVAGEFGGEHYGRGRASFTLIKSCGEWKIVHYEDSISMHFILPAVYRVQRPSLEQCISLIQTSQAEKCLPLLKQLLEPIPHTELSRANRPLAQIPGLDETSVSDCLR
jgi:ketosteroid isomerase-like protein